MERVSTCKSHANNWRAKNREPTAGELMARGQWDWPTQSRTSSPRRRTSDPGNWKSVVVRSEDSSHSGGCRADHKPPGAQAVYPGTLRQHITYARPAHDYPWITPCRMRRERHAGTRVGVLCKRHCTGALRMGHCRKRKYRERAGHEAAAALPLSHAFYSPHRSALRRPPRSTRSTTNEMSIQRQRRAEIMVQGQEGAITSC